MAASRANLRLDAQNAQIIYAETDVGKLDCPRVYVARAGHRNGYFIRLNAAYRNRNDDFHNAVRISGGNLAEVYSNGKILQNIGSSRNRAAQRTCNSRLTAATQVITLLLGESLTDRTRSD